MYNSFTPEELDFLNLLFDYDFFDISFDRHGEISSVYYDINDLDRYVDPEQIPNTSCIYRFVDMLEDIQFYHDYHGLYIQLNDNHTLWDINNENLTEYKYANAVDRYMEDFENQTDVSVYLLGRLGRHVCVDFTFDNVVDYDYLVNTQRTLEHQMIEELSDK